MATNHNRYQTPVKDVEGRVNLLVSQNHFRDIAFRVEVCREDGLVDVQHFNAHKLVLATASPVFAQNFYEINQDEKSMRPAIITVTDVTHKAFEMMFRYIYNDSVEFDTPYLALETYKVATKYKIIELQDLAVNHCRNCKLAPEDVIFILDNGYSDIDRFNFLYQRCLDEVERKPLEVIRLASEKAKPETLNMILQFEKMSALTEISILKALKDGVNLRKDITDSEQRRNYLRQFLKQIRFFTMTPQEFATALDICDGAIRPDEGYAIIRALCDPKSGTYNIPVWCNSNIQKRINKTWDFKTLDLNPPTERHSQIAYISKEITSLVNTIDIRVHGGRFVFTGIELDYKQVAESSTKCTLNIRNQIAGVAYEKITDLILKGTLTAIQFPVPLPVSDKEEARVIVILDNADSVDFSNFSIRQYTVENDKGRFEVLLNNYRTNDNTFAISKIYYDQI